MALSRVCDIKSCRHYLLDRRPFKATSTSLLRGKSEILMSQWGTTLDGPPYRLPGFYNAVFAFDPLSKRGLVHIAAQGLTVTELHGNRGKFLSTGAYLVGRQGARAQNTKCPSPRQNYINHRRPTGSILPRRSCALQGIQYISREIAENIYKLCSWMLFWHNR